MSNQVISTDSNNPSKSYGVSGSNLMTNGVVKSRKKTSLTEFALVKKLRPEILAGFKVWLGDKRFCFDEEWDDLFNKYVNRR